jgi:hypothetical protein
MLAVDAEAAPIVAMLLAGLRFFLILGRVLGEQLASGDLFRILASAIAIDMRE